MQALRNPLLRGTTQHSTRSHSLTYGLHFVQCPNVYFEAEPEQQTETKQKMDRFVLNARIIRSDFCFIVLALSLAGGLWFLLPPAAIGAQAYWGLQFTRSARRWHP